MKLTVIAHTDTNDMAMRSVAGFQGDALADIDHLSEFAGRSCYQSWEKKNPATAKNRGYHENILDVGHYSILEHGSITVYVEGVSRALTHELVRHRHLSYSQLSQRFVDESNRAPLVIPPAFAGSPSEGRLNALLSYVDHVTRDAYKEIVHILESDGKTRKQAREAGRSVLPNATETKIVVTGNLRAWRDFLHKRWDAHADAEIQEFAGLVLRELRHYAPNAVLDIPGVPFNTIPEQPNG
jgi:thymidylate synthase (FAD)